MKRPNAGAVNINRGRKTRCRSQVSVELIAPSQDAIGQDGSPVQLDQASSPAEVCEREQSTELSTGTSLPKHSEQRCRSRRSARRPPSSLSSVRRPQAPGNTDTLTLIRRLELVDRGIRPLELAALLGIGKSTLYDWVDAGTIPAYRHRGVIFFDPALIAGWLRRQATQRPPAV
jgi:excisionase family DNA binding protein